MSKFSGSFHVGTVNLVPIFGDITELRADALVQPSGTSPNEESQFFQASPWVIAADHDHSISQALAFHAPLELGRVIVTPAHNLPAKYLLHAVVIDWARTHSSNELVVHAVIEAAAKKCIEIAAALGVKTIAFTPWGTRAALEDAAQITAIMTQAIMAQVQNGSGELERVYLVSNKREHYQWFVDRAFVFQLLFAQVSEVQQSIKELDIPEQRRQHLLGLLKDLQNNVVVYNEIVGGDKITGNITESSGIMVGKDSAQALGK